MCFSPIRYLLEPLQVLPVGATSYRAGFAPARNNTPFHGTRRVERWRGGLGYGVLLGQGFPVCGAISVCHAPFPPPAHRTGRADFPHPALRLASLTRTRRSASSRP